VPALGVDDRSCPIGEFQNGGDRRSGRYDVGEGLRVQRGFATNWAEINGSEGPAVYRLHTPNQIMLGKTGSDLAPVEKTCPAEFLKPAGSPRDPSVGEPATVFRYDLMWEFISAITEGRDAAQLPGWLASEQVADACLSSHERRTWIDIPRRTALNGGSGGGRGGGRDGAGGSGPPRTEPTSDDYVFASARCRRCALAARQSRGWRLPLNSPASSSLRTLGRIRLVACSRFAGR
jgi:hypothetical protein